MKSAAKKGKLAPACRVRRIDPGCNRMSVAKGSHNARELQEFLTTTVGPVNMAVTRKPVRETNRQAHGSALNRFRCSSMA